jgi:hypothetical protein
MYYSTNTGLPHTEIQKAEPELSQFRYAGCHHSSCENDSDRQPSAIRLHNTDAGGRSVRFPAQGASLGLLIDEATHDPGRTRS